jgi:hypothetical protein
MQTLNISEEGFIKLMRIKTIRSQDKSRADTFDHILRVYEEYINEKKANQKKERGINPIPAKHAPGSVTSPITGHIIAGNVSSPIIDVDKLQNKAYMDSKRSIAQTIRNLKTTYPPEENKE